VLRRPNPKAEQQLRPTRRCRPDGAGEWGGAGGCKDFAPDGAAKPVRRTNRNAVAAFSPALTDGVGLRWVAMQNENKSEGVAARSGGDTTPSGLKNLGAGNPG